MGRPRKQPDDRKTSTLAFRLTAAERVQVEQAAERAGLSASEFARLQALRGRVVVPEARRLDHATFDELRRIGVNLNQLTRLANRGQPIPHEIASAAAALEAVLADALGHEPAPAPTEASPEVPARPTGADKRAAPPPAQPRKPDGPNGP